MLGTLICFGLSALLSLKTGKLLVISHCYSLSFHSFSSFFTIGNENGQVSLTGARYRDNAKSQGEIVNVVLKKAIRKKKSLLGKGEVVFKNKMETFLYARAILKKGAFLPLHSSPSLPPKIHMLRVQPKMKYKCHMSQEEESSRLIWQGVKNSHW